MPAPVEDREAIVDRFGLLKSRMKEYQPDIDEYERLGRRIKGWYDTEPADKSFTEHGSSYTVSISPRSNERLPDKPRIFAALGKRRFLELCGFTLKNTEKAFSGEELPRYVTETQTGLRRLDVQPVEVREAA